MPDELRPVSIETGTLKFAEGSAMIKLGDTHVLCSVTVNEDVPPFLKGKNLGWITAEYSMLPRSTKTRTPREITRGRPDGRTQEIQRLIGRSFRAVADLALLGERTLIVDCDVIQADGGTRTASITGGYVALALAIHALEAAGAARKGALKEPVAAVSAGIVRGAPVLDLNYSEDSTAGADVNIVMTGGGNLVEVQGTAEGAPFPEESLSILLGLARMGIQKLVTVQREAIARGTGTVNPA
jgi:ribonuclease PH